MRDWLAAPTVTRRQILKATLVLTSAVLWQGQTNLDAAMGKLTPPVAGFNWETLKDLTYPTAWTKSKLAPLQNGEFRRPTTTAGAPALFTYLCEPRVFGDLNGDGKEDAVVLLAHEIEGRGLYVDIVAVLNQDGMPRPLQPASLGDRLILKSLDIEHGDVVLRAGERSAGDGDSAPDQISRYRLAGNRLRLIEKIAPPPALNLRATIHNETQPAEIALSPTTLLALQAELAGQSIDAYRAGIEGNRRLRVALTAPQGNAVLSIYGDSDQGVLASVADEIRLFDGVTPNAQRYIVQVINLANQPITYTLTIQVTNS